ncbi:hypothetical protein RUM44_001677 [Polyplax serrata]|uniref:Jacalin-type lectin domain-containing protein n=1 Tax=Polyplax serrata TaxID=468196 RepID=A0ABR1AKR3_POLSC
MEPKTRVKALYVLKFSGRDEDDEKSIVQHYFNSFEVIKQTKFDGDLLRYITNTGTMFKGEGNFWGKRSQVPRGKTFGFAITSNGFYVTSGGCARTFTGTLPWDSMRNLA